MNIDPATGDALNPVEFIDGFANQSTWLPVSLFDCTTGEYLGTDTVYVNEGCTLSPGQTVDSPPLPPPAGQVFTRQGTTWTLTEDHRGTLYHTQNGAQVHHTQLGALPDDLTPLPRPSPFHVWNGTTWVCDLVLLHAAKSREIEEHYDAAVGAGFWSDALGGAHYYQSQAGNQLDLMMAMATGLDVPYGCANTAGVHLSPVHTSEQLRQISATFYALKMDCLKQAATLKNQLNQALSDGDQAALEAIHWLTDEAQS